MSIQPNTRSKPAASPARSSRRNFDHAHKAIHDGDHTIGDIASMVRDDPLGGDSFLRDDLPEFIELSASPVTMWNQELFGLRFKNAFALACVVGVAAGVMFGFMLHGTQVHSAMASVLPVLG